MGNEVPPPTVPEDDPPTNEVPPPAPGNETEEIEEKDLEE